MLECLFAWQRCSTQLRVGGMGGVLGFDYGAFAEVLKLYGLWRREIHEGLRIIEAEVLMYHAESMKKPDDPMDQTMSLYLAAKAEERVN